jgi:hypothetical protein
MIIVLNSLGLRGVSDVTLEYRGNCIKISQGVLPIGTAVTLEYFDSQIELSLRNTCAQTPHHLTTHTERSVSVFHLHRYSY